MTKQKTAKEMYTKLIERLESLISREQKAIDAFKKEIAECTSLEYAIQWKWHSTCIAEFMKKEHLNTLYRINVILEDVDSEPITPEDLMKLRLDIIDDWFFVTEGFRANSTCQQSNLHKEAEAKAKARVREIYKRFV